jgi:putative SbcD/Mre11-related phosphoesterase
LISPVFDVPLLLSEGEKRVLVASDIHIGLEHELMLGGITIPSQTDKILSRILEFLKAIKPDRLVLLGDVKHNVPRTSWRERREIPEFLANLSSVVGVDIVPGNHDSDLADMAPSGVRMHPSTGFVLDGIGYFHGHTWPDHRVLRADRLVAGHLHPAIRLLDPLGHATVRPVWAKAQLQAEATAKHYALEPLPGSCDHLRNHEIIIAPAFNHLCGGLALNEPIDDPHGPLMAMIDWDSARIFLLDGTELGTLFEIRSALNPR